MKYVLSTILMISVAAFLISERKPSTPIPEIKQTAVDTSAKKELLEGSVPPAQEVAIEEPMPAEDSIAEAKREAAEAKRVNAERKTYMAIIKKQIPRSLPYELSAATMQFPVHANVSKRDDAITNLIYGPGYGEYSRSVPRSYEFVAYLGKHEGYYLVVYRMASSVSDDIYPATYFLATLTGDGEVVSEKDIANMESPQHITVATIDAPGIIVSRAVTQTWQYKPEEAGYENNKVIKSEVTATAKFKISSDGTISGS